MKSDPASPYGGASFPHQCSIAVLILASQTRLHDDRERRHGYRLDRAFLPAFLNSASSFDAYPSRSDSSANKPASGFKS
jgi:hypothetical protein